MANAGTSYEANLGIRELGAFAEEFYKESDRGAVLVAASRLDEVLKSILAAYLKDDPSSNQLLEGFNAPLSTFSSRASLAYSLGLIEEIEFKEISLIRKIRNEFGHKWRDIGIESPAIRDLCLKLPGHGSESTEKGTCRMRFNRSVVVLLTDLLWREGFVAKERRTSRLWPNKMRAAQAAPPSTTDPRPTKTKRKIVDERLD
jgi:mannitol operon repressor